MVSLGLRLFIGRCHRLKTRKKNSPSPFFLQSLCNQISNLEVFLEPRPRTLETASRPSCVWEDFWCHPPAKTDTLVGEWWGRKTFFYIPISVQFCTALWNCRFSSRKQATVSPMRLAFCDSLRFSLEVLFFFAILFNHQLLDLDGKVRSQ